MNWETSALILDTGIPQARYLQTVHPCLRPTELMIKFADGTTEVELFTHNNETSYKNKVEHQTEWCGYHQDTKIGNDSLMKTYEERRKHDTPKLSQGFLLNVLWVTIKSVFGKLAAGLQKDLHWVVKAAHVHHRGRAPYPQHHIYYQKAKRGQWHVYLQHIFTGWTTADKKTVQKCKVQHQQEEKHFYHCYVSFMENKEHNSKICKGPTTSMQTAGETHIQYIDTLLVGFYPITLKNCGSWCLCKPGWFHLPSSGSSFINVAYAPNWAWKWRISLSMQGLWFIKTNLTLECAHLRKLWILRKNILETRKTVSAAGEMVNVSNVHLVHLIIHTRLVDSHNHKNRGL